MPMAIILLALFGCYCDHVVNTEDRERRLGSRSQSTDLGQRGLEHTRMDIVADLALHEIQTIPLQSLARFVVLSRIVVHAQRSDQIC